MVKCNLLQRGLVFHCWTGPFFVGVSIVRRSGWHYGVHSFCVCGADGNTPWGCASWHTSSIGALNHKILYYVPCGLWDSDWTVLLLSRP